MIKQGEKGYDYLCMAKIYDTVIDDNYNVNGSMKYKISNLKPQT